MLKKILKKILPKSAIAKLALVKNRYVAGYALKSHSQEGEDMILRRFFKNSHFINRILTDKRAIKYWKNIYENMKEQKIDTWDYQWTFTLWAKKQLTILPNLNLIKNIGFGPEATHTVHDSKLSKINNFELLLKEHPVEVRQNKAADNFTSKEVFVLSHFKRALNKLLKMVQK